MHSQCIFCAYVLEYADTILRRAVQRRHELSREVRAAMATNDDISDEGRDRGGVEVEDEGKNRNIRGEGEK